MSFKLLKKMVPISEVSYLPSPHVITKSADSAISESPPIMNEDSPRITLLTPASGSNSIEQFKFSHP